MPKDPRGKEIEPGCTIMVPFTVQRIVNGDVEATLALQDGDPVLFDHRKILRANAGDGLDFRVKKDGDNLFIG